MKKVILSVMHKSKRGDYLFYSYFEYLCKQKGISVNKACQEMGVSRSVAAKWKSTNTSPRMATLVKISDYFGVSIDKLLAHSNMSMDGLIDSTVEALMNSMGMEKPDILTDIGLDEQDKMILELSMRLTEDQKKTVIAQLLGLTQFQQDQDERQ